MRIAIAGVPKSGKTTLAVGMNEVIIHTDDLIELGWSQSSLAVSYLFNEKGDWIIEGVTVPRALRKWLKRNPEGKPVDKAIFLSKPREVLSKGQSNMAKGCKTVWREILPELRKRGIEIEEL